MSSPFSRRGDAIVLQLEPREASLLKSLPALIDGGADSIERLHYVAHPGDRRSEDRYQELVAGSLQDLRHRDRSAFDSVVDGEPVGAGEVEAFMRVVGEARIVLASRLGIEEDGWERRLEAWGDPEVAMLGWLGHLQDAAVGTLSETL